MPALPIDEAKGLSCLIVIDGGEGSVEPLRRVVKALPRTLAAGVVVTIQSQHAASDIAELIAHPVAMTLRQARDGERVERGVVLVAPPGQCLSLSKDGSIEFAGEEPFCSMRSGDLLFASAATHFGPRVIGLVMSGSGHDGTEGLRRIKAAGGKCIVQSPSDSQTPTMPTAALLGDHPDHCLLVQQIAPMLERLVAAKSRMG